MLEGLIENHRHIEMGAVVQSSGLQRQNDFLKAYVSRLQQQLIEYMGTHLPPPNSTITGAECESPLVLPPP